MPTTTTTSSSSSSTGTGFSVICFGRSRREPEIYRRACPALGRPLPFQ